LADIKSMDDYRDIEDVVKRRFNGEHVVFGVVLKDGKLLTYIPPDVADITLVYLIQTLKDRRNLIVDEVNS